MILLGCNGPVAQAAHSIKPFFIAYFFIVLILFFMRSSKFSSVRLSVRLRVECSSERSSELLQMVKQY